MGKQIRISAPTTEGAILRLLDVCNPADIATAVDLFIERLDAMAGDPDLEPNGDELDGSTAEDDFVEHNLSGPQSPGCPVADAGSSTDSGAGDPSWAEWHTRGRHKLGKFGEEACRRLDHNMAHEDDEDDLSDAGVEDDPNGFDAEEDSGVEDFGELTSRETIHQGSAAILARNDDDAWFVPVSLNPPAAENDQ